MNADIACLCIALALYALVIWLFDPSRRTEADKNETGWDFYANDNNFMP